MRNTVFPIRIMLALFMGLTVPLTLAQKHSAALAQKHSAPECFCTDKQGKRKELGDIVCLTVGGRSFRAKCVMAQNVPFWRDISEACLSSKLPEPVQSFASADITAIYK